ncbi:uncharacterized protein LOC122043852 [Zingiber officinale]|uniref:uncharacterized protein LOC122043852 n=1 Tax=Zingiber officinale TaxID=94328 RepID=UPI001C4B038E|nr:uncharacterized protein LOC122043852 [Zingiber officinale]
MNTLENNQMIAPKIQKQLVNACAVETINAILTDLRDRWFTLQLDEARDCSVKKQMTVVIRYVNKHGEVIELFMNVVHVATTIATCLKEAINSLFAKYGLPVARLRGQGYDGSSNMSDEFNGLKSLIMKKKSVCKRGEHIGYYSTGITLVNEGFDNWKRVNQGKTCAFLAHISSAASSPHTMCERKAENLMRPSQHIDNVMHAQSKEEKEKNHLRLRTSIVTVRWLALQGCAFRGNDESLSSSNRGNFLELVKAFAKMSTEIDEVVLENAPKNAQYIVPGIHKEILHIMANRVRKMVREEVSDKCFQRFFAIKSVSDTTSLNLKKEISNVLVHHDLQVKKSEAKDMMRIEIEHMLAIGERDSGSGANQIGNLQRAEATRWSSHYDSVKNLIDFILMELNARFNESLVELLSLSTALDPKNSFESINTDDICKLAMKFYPENFTNKDIIALKYELAREWPVIGQTNSMSFSGGGMLGGSPSPVPSHTPLFLLREGISLVLSRWEALQVAIRNQWGGGDSHQKHDELVSFILTFFSRPDVVVCVDDLEHALEEKMVLSFNTMVDDGSVEEKL